MDFFRGSVSNAIFQSHQGLAQSRTEVPISCNDLSELLQPGDLCNQAEQPFFRGSFFGELKLLKKLRGKAGRRESRHYKHHGVSYRWTPLQIRLRDKPFDGHNYIDDPSRHAVAHG